MRIDSSIYKEPKLWEAKGWHVPAFDLLAVRKKTRENPVWVHFGGGNIFRALIGRAVSGLLERGLMDRGLIVAESYDATLIDEIYIKHDLLSLAVMVDGSGTIEKSVVSSIGEALHAAGAWPEDMKRLKTIFSAPSLQMVSFTITEKGYTIADSSGEVLLPIRKDIENGPNKAASILGIVSDLLLERYNRGRWPIALVSMDNCSSNGALLWRGIHMIAKGWEEQGWAPKGFCSYVDDPDQVAFPWTMIDKITPRPSQKVTELLEADDIEDLVTVDTKKHTFASAFVNSEAFECLVIEDRFPGGRPPLEQAGFIMTDRDHVERSERMKVCTCLNPLHTMLAVFGCLLGKKTIAEAVADPVLGELTKHLGYDEGLPVVTDPEVISPKAFLDDVIENRLPNSFIPDTPERIATDTSMKISVRFGQTIKAWQERKMDTGRLKVIPLVLAGWLRYLTGTNDRGEPVKLSPDPRLSQLCPVVEAAAKAILKRTVTTEVPNPSKMAEDDAGAQGIKAAGEVLEPLLKDESIWGCDLYRAGLVPEILRYFGSMLAGPGAVYKTLKSVLEQEAEKLQ